MENLNIFNFGSNCNNFCKGWIKKLDYINSTMKAIRKVQNDCQMLDMCSNKEVIEKHYYGYIFNSDGKLLKLDPITEDRWQSFNTDNITGFVDSDEDYFVHRDDYSRTNFGRRYTFINYTYA